MSRIYLDMDGVLADYEGGIAAAGVKPYAHGKLYISRPRSEWPQEMVDADVAYVGCMARPDFWPGLKVLPGAHELVDAAIAIVDYSHVFILTATPNRMEQYVERIARQKVEWAQEHLGFKAAQVITCPRANKKHYATPGSVLVDDTPANCEEWRTTGNIAIHYTTAAKAIKQLQETFNVGWR